MKSILLLPLLAAAGLAAFVPNPHCVDADQPYSQSLEFLLQSNQQGNGLPSSYKDVLPDGRVYWGTKTYLSVGAFSENGTRVNLDSEVAIQERTLTRFGLNLYDGAVWQIALALANRADVAQTYERNILYPSTTGAAGRDNGNPGGIVNIRADSTDFKYGPDKTVGSALRQITYPGNATHFTQGPDGKPSKEPVKKGPGALFYRMIGPKYQMVDPMDGNYANSWKYPFPNPDERTPWNNYGLIHFNDWKPIVGENVWAAITGPIQVLQIITGGNLTNTTCGSPESDPPVWCDFQTFDTTPAPIQLAISILPALEALQSTLGSLFHCPWGAKIFPYDAEEGFNVSNENNASAFAALIMLRDILRNFTKGTNDEVLSYALTTTEKLVDGLEKWFTTNLFSPDGELPDGVRLAYQGGHINDSGFHPAPLNGIGGIAVDCQTWGMTVLGVDRLDKIQDGFAYKVWQGTKKYAGYYQNGYLAGVGYTSLNQNSSAAPNNKIWSAEWTFGAINMAQVLAAQYQARGNAAYASDLMADAQSMWNAVSQPWPKGLRFSDGSYVYANMRFFIPWGWYANPISALCSTAWAVMQEQNYNPFEYGGGNKPQLVKPSHLASRTTEPSYVQ